MDTIKPTEITFDPAKNEANIRERGLAFALVRDEFDWATAQVIEDTRRNYGEKRYRAIRREERRYGAQTEPGTD